MMRDVYTALRCDSMVAGVGVGRFDDEQSFALCKTSLMTEIAETQKRAPSSPGSMEATKTFTLNPNN